VDLFAYRNAGITENRHLGAAVNRPFFSQLSFAPKKPNEINALFFMRKF
jgi:hypothetical protein